MAFAAFMLFFGMARSMGWPQAEHRCDASRHVITVVTAQVEPLAVPDPASFVPTRRSTWSWILYDLANTIFSLNILSLYFSLWVVNDQGGRDAHFTLATSISMACILVLAPSIGVLSDRVPRRLPWLIATTIGCCVLTALLGLGGLWVSLAIFIGANIFYQAGLLFYDTLLPSVSTPENRGRVGSLGVGLGYLGSLVGIGIGALTLALRPDDDVWIFRVTALAFFLLALPCFLFVRERPRASAVAMPHGVGGYRFRDVGEGFRLLRRYPELRRFLVGHLLYADAANTAIAVMGIYATKELGFSEAQTQIVLLVGILGAISGALLLGRIVDPVGPKRTLSIDLVVWLLALGAFAAIPVFELPRDLFWPAAFVAGAALGGLWTADRPFMLRLTPPERLGQFYGIYSMVGRFAAILGPLAWAIIVDGLGWGRPAAVAALMIVIAAALVTIRPVSDHQRTSLPVPNS
jgi:UMF1 family MFS transporter